jgi:hypothetical protein
MKIVKMQCEEDRDEGPMSTETIRAGGVSAEDCRGAKRDDLASRG